MNPDHINATIILIFIGLASMAYIKTYGWKQFWNNLF